MKINTSDLRRLSVFILLFFCFTVLCLAQESNSQLDTSTLIRRLKDKDERVAVRVVDLLINRGSEVVPPLIAFLNAEKECLPRVLAASVIYKLDRKNGVVVPTLANVMKNKCYSDRQKDIVIRREAAFALATIPEGIRVLVETFKDKDTFNRQSAAFAFDELTERIEEGRPDKIEPTPEIIGATKAAIPSLIEAMNDKDEIVRCMSYESIEQLQRSQHEELREEANRLMQGVKVRCSR